MSLTPPGSRLVESPRVGEEDLPHGGRGVPPRNAAQFNVAYSRSGIRGDVFDRYLRAITERIVSRLNLDPGTRPVEKAVNAFCKALARESRDSLGRERSAEIVNQFATGRAQWPDTLFGQLLSEGVLTADVAWHRAAGGPVDVIRFTYQRFADYRVASTLLESSIGDPQRLRESLVAGGSLRRRVLKAPAGWIEALAVLIPERFDIELLDAATWRLDSFTRRQWNRAFVKSVATRRPSAVTEQTRVLLSRISRQSRKLMNALVRETLLTVALLPEHPLRDVLHERLKAWPMPARDVAWSIPTYSAFDAGGTLDRLIRWAARGPYPSCPDGVIEAAAVPIVWTFTSPNRRMRDYATKALSQLLSGSLPALPALIRRFDGVDDPYVIERLAVVSHGAVLCGGRSTPESAVAVARELKRVALAEAQTPNIITRDAVRGVHEWCSRQGLIEDHEYAEMLPPYSAAPPGRSRTEKLLESAYDREKHRGTDIKWPYAGVFMSIFMLGDFGRYVIESKVSDFSQHPLSSAHPQWDAMTTYEAESAKCWVFERVLSLGWTPERFARFDNVHTGGWAGRSEHKAERFGKKYQWIALRELLARIADNFHMIAELAYAGPWQFFGRDIDPTLPPPPRRRNDDDGFDLEPTFTPDGGDAWWLPRGPTYGPDDPPVGAGWAVEDDGDIPEFGSLVRRKDADGARWVVLHSYHRWDEKIPEDIDKWTRHRRDLWSHIYSWLVRPADLEACVAHIERRSLMGRWMPEGMQHTDAGYLGELPWAVAAGEFLDDWQEIRGAVGIMPTGIEVYPTWAEYLWEGNVLDCSIEHGVHALFPAPALFEAGELRWVPGHRAWCRPDGMLVAQYHEATDHGALQVREDWLKQILRRTGHALVFGWLGEKQLIKAGLRAV